MKFSDETQAGECLCIWGSEFFSILRFKTILLCHLAVLPGTDLIASTTSYY